MVAILLGNGFEPVEAIAPCDILRRGGVETRLVGIGGTRIAAGHGITVEADITIDELDADALEMIVLPGGRAGVESILGCDAALKAVTRVYKKGKYVAAICAAPTILAMLGITERKKATCYPGMEQQMGCAIMLEAPTVTDGKIITGQAAGASLAFGLALLEALRGKEAAKNVANAIVYR